MRYNDGRERHGTIRKAIPRMSRDVGQDELVLLTAIIALASQLPDDLAFYGSVLGDIRKDFFKLKSAPSKGRRGEGPRGFATARSTRAYRRYGT